MKTEAGKYEEALALIISLMALDPENTKVLALKAYVEYKSDKIDEALATGEKLAKLFPDDPDTLYNRSLVLIRADKKLEAREILKKLETHKGDDKDVLVRLAEIEEFFEAWAEAANYQRKVLEIDGKSAKAHDTLVRYLVNMEEYAKAIDACDSGLKAFPDDGHLLFRKAELDLTVAGSGKTGLESLVKALEKGFADTDRVKSLLANQKLTEREAVEKALKDKNLFPKAEEKKDEKSASEALPKQKPPSAESDPAAP